MIKKAYIENIEINVHYINYLPKSIDAITIKNHIFIRKSKYKELSLLIHEAVHVLQWNNTKYFLIKYLFSYISLRLKGNSHKKAYYSIPFEIVAYKKQREYENLEIFDNLKD
jgi:hypothetical protein